MINYLKHFLHLIASIIIGIVTFTLSTVFVTIFMSIPFVIFTSLFIILYILHLYKQKYWVRIFYFFIILLAFISGIYCGMMAIQSV